MSTWYIGSTKFTAVAQWQASKAYVIRNIIRATNASAVERCYVCYKAGTSAASAPSFTGARGSTFTTGTAEFIEITGQPSMNGDSTNIAPWPASTFVNVGMIVKNTTGTPVTYFIVMVAGTTGVTEPTWNKTAGTNTTDGTASWKSLGPITNYSTKWAAPHCRIYNADASGWGADGDTFYVSNNHDETTNTLTPSLIRGTATNPSRYLCVDDANVPPTQMATTAFVRTGTISMVIGANYASFYTYGLNFITGDSSPSGSNYIMSVYGDGSVFENCSFKIGSDGANAYMWLNVMGPTFGGYMDFMNCTYSYSHADQTMYLGGGTGLANKITFVGGSIAATGATPNNAIVLSLSGYTSDLDFTVRDVDLSGVSNNLFSYNVPRTGRTVLENCKLASGVVLMNGSFTMPLEMPLEFYNCDNGSTNYQIFTQTYMGTLEDETTIVRNGGASNGATTMSWKMMSSSASYQYPLEAQEIAIWNASTGSSMTATVEIASSSALNTRDIWLEIEYPGNSGSPLGSVVTTRPAIIAGATAISGSSATWSGSPASRQQLTVSFTPLMAGVIKARIYLAKSGTTVYVDPMIVLSNNVANRRQYTIPGYGSVNETAQGEFSAPFVS